MKYVFVIVIWFISMGVASLIVSITHPGIIWSLIIGASFGFIGTTIGFILLKHFEEF